MKPANLLCGDCIINYKTVQSLGYENMIIEKYETLLSRTRADFICNKVLIGLALGFAQLA